MICAEAIGRKCRCALTGLGRPSGTDSEDSLGQLIRRRHRAVDAFVPTTDSGLRTDRTASTVIRGHALIQNVRRGNYELGVQARLERLRVAAAFDELAEAIRPKTEATPCRIRIGRPSAGQ
jgi:hypothetical protein